RRTTLNPNEDANPLVTFSENAQVSPDGIRRIVQITHGRTGNWIFQYENLKRHTPTFLRRSSKYRNLHADLYRSTGRISRLHNAKHPGSTYSEIVLAALLRTGAQCKSGSGRGLTILDAGINVITRKH